ncbi:unnamed protein product [Brassicogethes aeneus]|uniref:Cytochrome c oxidase assembly factor 7 n=1 Tax=Brassicogethes aeneus TaxID=1431903 RepID=A0A9P0AT22_BRAAE|nr:unnamed protein product [Brassicogethes aeneus]
MSVDIKSESEVKDYIKNLGIEYRFGCYSEKNPEVCHLLADFLESIKKDYEKAAKVYKNNCDEFKYGKSCLKFGTYSLLGKGLPKADFVNAYGYFEKGCNLNDTESCLNQGLLLCTSNDDKGVPHDVITGLKLLEKACSGKNANACYYLSGMYIAGVRKKPEKDSKVVDFVIQKNMQKAFMYAMDGCNLGNMYSCANLSQMYAKGDGVEKSKELADRYKKLAIDMQKEVENAKTLTFQEGLKPT